MSKYLGVPHRAHADLMRRRWLSHGNTYTPTLFETWQHLCRVLNQKVQELGSNSQRDWHVCCPATGTGKTESLIVYASLLHRFSPAVGMLIVTRLKATADEMCDAINAQASKEIAAACHTGNEFPADELAKYPVAVITHAAFAKALEWSNSRRSKWESFTRYGDSSTRGLVVIDEAIDLLDFARLTEDELARFIGNIPSTARSKWPSEVQYLDDLLRSLRAWLSAMRAGEHEQAQIIRTDDEAAFARLFQEVPDLSELKHFMESRRYFGNARRGTGSEANEYAQKDFGRIITEVEALAKNFLLYHKSGQRATFNTAHCILPDDAHGCVILDATAQTNRLYDVMSREGELTVHVHRPPVGARSYRNLRVRVARVSATGKGHMTGTDETGADIGKREAERLLSWMEKNIDPTKHKEVFLACHLDNEAHFAGVELPFNLKAAHYGAIDGRNDFRNCTAAVIFGLSFRNPVDASLSFFAFQGVQPDDWLKDEARRRFRDYQDIKRELWIGWTVTSLVQTVNRIATRRVVTGSGDCPPCELFMLLPRGDLGDTIERKLMEQLPDAPLPLPWDFETTAASTTRKRKTNLRDVLIVFIKNMEQGAKFPASWMQKQLGMSPRRWKSLTAEMQDNASALAAVMRACGVAYIVERQGSRSVAYLSRPALAA